LIISLFGLVFLLGGIITCTHRPQGVTVAIYKFSDISYLFILKQKGVMQTNRLADVKLPHFRKTFTVICLQAYSSASYNNNNKYSRTCKCPR